MPSYDYDPNTAKVIDRLAEHGWQRTPSGVALNWANLSYDAPQSRLEVDYMPGETSLGLQCDRHDGEYELLIEFGDQLDELLDLLTEAQATLGPETWDDFVDRLVDRLPRVSAVYGEDEDDIVPLTSDE